MPPVVKEWGSDDAVLRLQDRVRDIYSRFLGFWIRSGRQEGSGVCQMCCGRVDAAQLKMVFATRPKTHPIFFVDLRGESPTGKTHRLADVLETFSGVSSWG